MGVFEYGTNHGFLKFEYATDKNGNKTCYLSNESVELFDKQNKIMGEVPFKWNCNKGFHHAGDSVNGGISPSNDALYNITFVVETYEKLFNERFLPEGQKLPVKVHFRTDYPNAFWRKGSITLGDGDDTMHPLTSLDILAHELSHGITEKYSKLIYEGESGGLNESFSDMAGKTLEAIHDGTTETPNKISWTIGEDVVKGSHPPIRYMDNPEKDGHSISLAKKAKTIDGQEGIDPHWSSGVFNKAFYLMVTSKDANGKYIGLVPVFEIMLLANKTQWQPNTTFDLAAEGVLKAEKELHRAKYRTAIINAFTEVGIKCNPQTLKCKSA